MRNTTEKKRRMYYVREYRRFSQNALGIVLFLLLCVLPVTVLMTLLYAPISRWICNWAGPILSNVLHQEIGMQEHLFLPWLRPVTSLTLIGHGPGWTQIIIVAIVSILAIILTWQIDGGLRSFFIYVNMGLYILLASCIFFIFWPDRFPYTLSEFSSLYMLQQASLGILIPLILGVTLALLPTNFILKLAAVAFCCVTNVLVDGVRYLVFLFILAKFSSLYMASLYFTFGVLFDFIRMVLIFSFTAKIISETMQSPKWRGKWEWG